MRIYSKLTTTLIFALVLSFTAFGQTKVAPLNIEQRTLPNGLKVVSLQDNSSPTAAIHFGMMLAEKTIQTGVRDSRICLNI